MFREKGAQVGARLQASRVGVDMWATPDCARVLWVETTKAHGTSREARDAFTCFPCTRPEGALLYEGANGPGIKKKPQEGGPFGRDAGHLSRIATGVY
jgi:hypothetical protein